MSNGEGLGPQREATLDAVHSDQLGLSEQLRTLSEMFSRIEEHLLGSEHANILSAAQAKASITPGKIMPAPALDVPELRGLLPQMCDLGISNAQIVIELQGRVTSISHLLSVPNT